MLKLLVAMVVLGTSLNVFAADASEAMKTPCQKQTYAAYKSLARARSALAEDLKKTPTTKEEQDAYQRRVDEDQNLVNVLSYLMRVLNTEECHTDQMLNLYKI